MDIGKSVVKYRKERSLTQQKLSVLIGCSRTHLAQLENGRSKFTMDIYLRISKSLELHPCTILWDAAQTHPDHKVSVEGLKDSVSSLMMLLES